MSMMFCSACGTEMSAQAAACPKCGKPNAPTSDGQRRVGFGLGLGIFFLPGIFSWFLLRKGHTLKSRIVGFGWLAFNTCWILLVFAMSAAAVSSLDAELSGKHRHAIPAVTEAPDAPLPAYTIQQIAKAYDSNTVAADQQYKGKRFKVTGTVSEISTDFMGTAYINMRGGVNEFMEPHLDMDSDHQDYTATLKKGMKITLICTGDGDVIKAPHLDDCVPTK